MGEYEREIELYDYIEVLLKYKWLILVATLACGSLAWLLKPTAPPPLYEADIVLMVKELSSQQEGTDQAVAAQSSGFYETLARDDGLKQAVLDSIGPLLARLNINLTLTAMDGLLSVAVLDPGIKLTVRHSHPDLPIPLVSAWADLFVTRNSDLNSEEGGRYYDYVEQQYRTVNDRLKANEDSLHAFEIRNRIGVMQIQQAQLDSSTLGLFHSIMRIESALLDTNLLIQAADIKLQSLLPEYRPTYRQLLDQLQALDINTPHETFYNTIHETLRQFDRGARYEYRIEQYVPVAIASLDKQLKDLPQALGNAPNPAYVSLAEKLTQIRERYGDRTAKESKVEPSAIEMVVTRETYNTLLEQRQRISEMLDLIAQRWVYKARIRSSEQLRLDIGDSLSSKMRDHQHLLRNQTLLEETLNRLSTLVEEARISRAKSANDIRILTQALEVRSIPQTTAQQKTAIAAGVGFLLSAVLSLLVEYVRKARALRAAA